MKLYELVKAARRDFIEAGEEGHFACPADHRLGYEDGRLCLVGRFTKTEWRLVRNVEHTLNWEEAWQNLHGELPVYTNERGFEVCVEAYDALVLSLAERYEPEKTREAVLA